MLINNFAGRGTEPCSTPIVAVCIVYAEVTCGPVYFSILLGEFLCRALLHY